MKQNFKRTAEDDAGGPALDLEKAIAEFYAEFPEHKKDVFILNQQKFKTGKEAVESLSEEFNALAEANPKAMLPFAKSLAKGAFEHKLPMSVNITDSLFALKPETPVFGRIVIPSGDEYSARLLKSVFVGADPIANDRFPTMKDEYNNTEMWHRYVLDHELGHALTQLSINKQSMKTSSLANKAESEADAYSMIRHYQRYGDDSKFPEFIRDLRTMNAIHKGDIVHWTAPALDEVIALNKQGKLKDLTPHEARDLAVQIAAKHHLTPDAEYNMGMAFTGTIQITKNAMTKHPTDGDKAMDYLGKVCEIGANTQSPAVLDACQRYFIHFKEYIPADAAITKKLPEIKKIAADAKAMNEKILSAEPPIDGLKRAFRDAMIDFQSGKKPEKKDDKQPPQPKPPKAA